MLKYELFKLFSKKLFIIFIALCLLNIVQIYYIENKTISYAADGEYKELWGQVNTSIDESGLAATYDAMKEESEEKQQFRSFYYLYMSNLIMESNYDSEFLKRAYQRIKENPNINLVELSSEGKLYEQIINELESLVFYDEYLQAINTNATQLSKVSIFRTVDSYANRIIEKTPVKYQKMNGIELTAAPSKGVELFSKSVPTDLIAIFLLVYCAVIIWTREKEDGIKPLLFSCYRGRGKLAGMKLLTMAIVCFFIEIALYSGNLYMAEKIYGIGDLSRYLPSVYSFSQTTWKITVLQYFVLFLVIKYIAFLVLSFLFLVISDLFNNMVYIFGGIMMMVGCGVLAYTYISTSSVFAILKYLLPYGFLRTETLFFTYINLNLFGYPVDLTVCIFLLFLIFLIALPILVLRLYVRRTKGKSRINIIARFTAGFSLHGGRRSSLWYHEFYKVFINQRILTVLLIAGLLQFVAHPPQEETLGSINALYYKQYLLKLSGPLTKEKENYIIEQQNDFEKLSTLMNEAVAEGFNTSSLEDKLKPYQAFQRVLDRYGYLKDKEGSYFVYEIPFYEFTAGYNNQNDSKLALLYLLLLILCAAGVFGMDYQYRAERLCGITLKGRYQAVFIKLVILLLMNILIMSIVYLPFVIQKWNTYGMEFKTLSYPVNSIPNLSGFRPEMSIGMYLILTYITRFLFGIILSLAVCMIAFKVRNVVGTILLSVLIFGLPTAFLLISETFIQLYYPFTPILGNLFWTYPLWKIFILTAFLMVAAGIMLYRIVFRHQSSYN